MKEKIFLSDNDGTLTVARKPIVGEMAETLIKFADKFRFSVITGSPYSDMVAQMPPLLLSHPNVEFWCCMGNVLYKDGKEIYNSNKVIDFKMFEGVLKEILEVCPYKFNKSYPRHHEINNNCAINFTMLGRPEEGQPSEEDRAEYMEWDSRVGQRQWIIKYLSEKYPDYNMTLGGQISVDIVKKGSDKAQVANYYKNYQITYFGDRIYKTGNDNSIAREVIDLGGSVYSVLSPLETMKIMQTLINEK